MHRQLKSRSTEYGWQMDTDDSRTFSYQTFPYQMFPYQTFHYQDISLPRLFPTSDFSLPRRFPTKTFPYQDFSLLQTFPYQDFSLPRCFPTKTFPYQNFSLPRQVHHFIRIRQLFGISTVQNMQYNTAQLIEHALQYCTAYRQVHSDTAEELPVKIPSFSMYYSHNRMARHSIGRSVQ